MSPTHANETEARQHRHIAAEYDRAHFSTHCVNCVPGDCPIYVLVKDGKVVREEAAGVVEAVEEGVPDMNPMICQKGLAWSIEHDAEDRVPYPMRRAGERGEGKWQRISWDEALAEVADAMIDAIEDVGPEAVVMEMSPEVAAFLPSGRFMSALGGQVLDVDATINDFFTGYQQTFGKFSFTASVDDTFHCDLILIWHSNPAHTMIPVYHYTCEARYRGAEVVLVSTDVSPSHCHVDYHVPVRHGTDAALALAMAQVVIAEDLVDWGFAASQTDLSLLVRSDNGEFLRQRDVEPDGREDRFFHGHPERGIVAVDPASLGLDFEPLREGALEVDGSDGSRIRVEPLFARVRRMLDAEYTPEQASEICEAHPQTIRMLARKVAAGRTRIAAGAGVCKYYHGDLMTRGMLLLLGLTGNWGRKGTGVGAWCSSLFDGMTSVMVKSEPGVEAGREMFQGMNAMREALRQQDPSLTGELADRVLLKAATGRTIYPAAFFWYLHSGFRERWNNPDWNDPDMPRGFESYFEEAARSGAWGDAVEVARNKPPRVLLEVGGNTLRRTRGGKGVLLENLWPKLEKIICVDYRMSQTALYSDIVLPATQHYEKTGFGMPTPWPFMLAMSSAVVEPYQEARGEWPALAELCTVLAERAKARGLEDYPRGDGTRQRYAELWDRFTMKGALATEEGVVRESLADAVETGNMPPGTTVETFREKGYVRYSGWSAMALGRANASPFPHAETHSPLRNHIELGHPYPTLTRRAQFLIDHPWYREAGEDLPVHKEPPFMGGDYPFRLSGGHSRWSIHAMNITNPLMLETHRGKPFVLINDAVARERGIEDDALVRIRNDVGEFAIPARTSPCQRPDGLTVYNGFEGFQFVGGHGSNEVEPGMVKWLHLVGDYGHLSYAPTEWQPVPFDRCIFVDVEPA
ncbi:MAG: molybdopterin-dependent oxidoreductase [Deltaproteobacteria bacterium]|nr:molybdopterin-dependent oxidoreductase [Deltaproteobacteria bacterium]